jgi:hypothetical protein
MIRLIRPMPPMIRNITSPPKCAQGKLAGCCAATIDRARLGRLRPHAPAGR